MTEEKRLGRRLAAIVAADVAGYSRLMGLDEVGTARTLREHRKVTACQGSPSSPNAHDLPIHGTIRASSARKILFSA